MVSNRPNVYLPQRQSVPLCDVKSRVFDLSSLKVVFRSERGWRGVADADAAVLISTNVASLPPFDPPAPPDEGTRNRDPIPDTPQPPS